MREGVGAGRVWGGVGWGWGGGVGGVEGGIGHCWVRHAWVGAVGWRG